MANNDYRETHIDNKYSSPLYIHRERACVEMHEGESYLEKCMDGWLKNLPQTESRREIITEK